MQHTFHKVSKKQTKMAEDLPIEKEVLKTRVNKLGLELQAVLSLSAKSE